MKINFRTLDSVWIMRSFHGRIQGGPMGSGPLPSKKFLHGKVFFWKIIFHLKNFLTLFRSSTFLVNDSCTIRINKKYKKFWTPLKKISGYAPGSFWYHVVSKSRCKHSKKIFWANGEFFGFFFEIFGIFCRSIPSVKALTKILCYCHSVIIRKTPKRVWNTYSSRYWTTLLIFKCIIPRCSHTIKWYTEIFILPI